MAEGGERDLEDSSFLEVNGILAKYQKHIRLLQTEIIQLRKQLAMKTRTLEISGVHWKKQCEEEQKKWTQEKQKIQEECSSQKMLADQNKVMAKDLIGSLERAQTELRDKDIEISDLEKRLGELNFELDTLQREMSKLKGDFQNSDQYQATVIELRQTKDEIGELKSVINSLNERLIKKNDHLENNVEHVKTDLVKVKYDMRSIDRKIENGMKDMFAEMQEMKEIIKNMAAASNTQNKNKEDANEDDNLKNTKKQKKSKSTSKPVWRQGRN